MSERERLVVEIVGGIVGALIVIPMLLLACVAFYFVALVLWRIVV